MDMFLAGQRLTISVPLTTADGSSVTDATDVSFRVLDSHGAELVPATQITVDPGMALADIVVEASANQLQTGEIRAFRQIEVMFTSAGNTCRSYQEYMVEIFDALVPMTNSFQTYGDAMVLAADLTGLDTFQAATRRERNAGMTNAYLSITGLRFLNPRFWPNYVAWRLTAAPGWYNYDEGVNLRGLTVEDFDKLPKVLTSALKRAQIIEANEALDQFSILKKRQQGLMSETIGESSMMFRPEKVLNVPVTRRSLDLLRPFLDWSLGLGRG